MWRNFACEYGQAKGEWNKSHSLVRYIQEEVAAQVRDALPAKYQQFLVQGKPGTGDWTRQPFIAVMDPAITKTTADG